MLDKQELQALTNCALCANMCKYTCPIYLASGSETLSPQKIARLILYEDKDLLEDRQGFFDVVFSSAMCGACSRHCIYEAYDLRKFIQKARSKAHREGALPEETRKRLETFREFGNPNGERQLVDEGTSTAGYFLSCSGYKDEGVLRAMRRIVEASGQQVRIFGGADICCGAPLYYAGDTDGFEGAARKMAADIREKGLDRVIVDCPNCMRMMTKVYPEVGVDLQAEVIHTSEFLLGLLREGRIEVRKESARATYHDPCILANDFHITEAPRAILGELGFELQEPAYSENHAHCCGGPAGARIGHAGLADKVRTMRIAELKQTEAEVYASACPTCKAVLSESGIKDVTELVAERIVNGPGQARA